MKQSLQLKLGQQLTMTPQLQQAIRLLQLSTMDLQQEIQQALESNPLLEVSEDDDYSPGSEDAQPEGTEASSDGPLESLEQAATDSGADSPEDWSGNEADASLPDELPVDTQWDDLLPSASAPAPAPEEGGDNDFDARNAAGTSLREQLLAQLSLTRLSDTDRLIALTLIDATDTNGRLMLSLEEVHESLADNLPDLDIEIDEVVAVLRLLQHFEPAGVCTRDLQECLLVQLDQLPEGTPWLEQAKVVISRHLNQLASSDFAQIQRRMRLKEEELREILTLIQSLEPQPWSNCSARRN